MTPGLQSVIVKWTSPSDVDLDTVEVWENTSSTTPNPSTQPNLLIGSRPGVPGQQQSFTRSGLATGSTRWYWVRAKDLAGNWSGFTGPVSTAPQVAVTADAQPGAWTDSGIARNSGAISIAPGGTGVVSTAAITVQSSDAAVLVTFSAYLNPLSGPDDLSGLTQEDWANIRLVRWVGATPNTLVTDTLATAVLITCLPANFYMMEGGRVALTFVDEPGAAGSWAYDIQVDVLSAAPGNLAIRSRTLTLSRADR